MKYSQVKFSSMRAGDTFKTTPYSKVFMTFQKFHPNIIKPYGVICVSTGEEYIFEDDTLVYPIVIKLIEAENASI